MKSVWTRTICRLLVALTIWTPFHLAQAGMIGTEQVATSSSQADRSTIVSYLSRSEVASQLHLSKRTVESHLESIYGKLGVGSKTELILRANELGI